MPVIKSSSQSVKEPIRCHYILSGDSRVGKTALIRSITGRYSNEDVLKTRPGQYLQIDQETTNITVDGQVVLASIMVCNHMGSYEYQEDTLTRGADVLFQVFDVNDRKTFKNIDDKHLYKNDLNEKAVKFLVGTKTDVDASKRQVSSDEAKKFAEENGMQYIEVSAKNGNNVQKLFTEAARQKIALDNKASSTEQNKVSFTGSEKKPPMLDAMLSGKLTVEKVNSCLLGQDIFAQLKSLENAFSTIAAVQENKDNPRTSKLFKMHNAEYSDKQLENIAVLKKVYYQCIKSCIADKKFSANEAKYNLLEQTVQDSKLVKFQRTRYAALVTETTTTEKNLTEEISKLRPGCR